jgi:hypothetical protein
MDQAVELRERLPKPRCSIIGGRQDAAITRECRLDDQAGVAPEDGDWCAIFVPKPRRVVAGGGQDEVAVGRDTQLV